MLGEQVQFACNNVPTVIPQVKAGALRALFVTTDACRISRCPSAREAGYPDMEKIVGWTALMDRRHAEGGRGPVGGRLREAREGPRPRQSGNAKPAALLAIRSPADTERFVRQQFELYDGLVTSLGIRQ